MAKGNWTLVMDGQQNNNKYVIYEYKASVFCPKRSIRLVWIGFFTLFLCRNLSEKGTKKTNGSIRMMNNGQAIHGINTIIIGMEIALGNMTLQKLQ